MDSTIDIPLEQLAKQIKSWGKELGFQKVGICDGSLDEPEKQLFRWLENGFHGEMEYMEKHGTKRTRPSLLLDKTQRIISVRMNYLPPDDSAAECLGNPANAFISRYALGRDYHKTLKKRLKSLRKKIQSAVGSAGQFREFVDSAPVMEKPLAAKAGLGWVGKHTNLLCREQGSWFFLGELYTNLALPVDEPTSPHCGECEACIDICPTGAIIAPYQLDARLCVSYLTIELKGAIPEHLRPLIGNRIYGCDDCQMVCPWNRFSTPTPEVDFLPRNGLDAATLVELFSWNEETFNKRTEGSAIRRINHIRWLRNIAVALGNGPMTPEVLAALGKHVQHPDALVREHVNWALAQLKARTE